MTPLSPFPSFDLQLRLKWPYPALEGALQALLAGKELILSEGLLSGQIRLESLQVLPPEGGQLVMSAAFGGTFSGALILRGRPEAGQDGQVRLAEPRYELQTGSLLLRAGQWMFRRKLDALLEEKATYNLQPLIRERLMAARAAEWKGFGWQAGVEDPEVNLTFISVLDEGLEVQLSAKGALRVQPPRS